MRTPPTIQIREQCKLETLLGGGVRGDYKNYVYDNLQTFSRKRILEGKEWEKKSRHCVVSMCYNNSRVLALKNEDFKYYEGFYLVYGMVLEHAFIVYKNKVFDPTATKVGFLNDIAAWGGVHVPTEFIRTTTIYSPLSFEYYLHLTKQPGYENGSAKRLMRF